MYFVLPARTILHLDDNVYDLFYQVKYLLDKNNPAYDRIIIVDINKPAAHPKKIIETFESLIQAIVVSGQPDVVGIDLFVDIAPFYIEPEIPIARKYPDCPCNNLEYPAAAEFSCFLNDLSKKYFAKIVINTKLDLLDHKKNKLYYPLECVVRNNICYSGLLQPISDRDGIHRHYFVFAESTQKDNVCSFAQVIACSAKGYDHSHCEKICNKSELITSVFDTSQVEKIKPLLRGSAGMYKYIDAEEIILHQNDKAYLQNLFKGKIVLIGTTLLRHKALIETPYSKFNNNINSKYRFLMPYIEFQANVIESILKNKNYQAVPEYVNVLLAGVILLLCVYFMFKFPYGKGIAATLVILMFFFVAAFVLFYVNNMVVNVVTALVTGVLVIPIVFGYRYVTVSRLFGKYVSSEVLYLLWQKKDNMVLTGEKRFITVMFTDIRGFTTLSEKTPPEQLLELLNEYFERMSAIIEQNQGYLNKFIGDGLMIIFGAPLEKDGQKKAATMALKTADEMVKELHRLNQHWQEKFGISGIEIGAGIHSGEAIVGNIGSSRRLEYSAIGDTINLAARLESANKDYKTNILISEDTYELVKDSFKCIKLGETKVKGRDKPVTVYTIE